MCLPTSTLILQLLHSLTVGWHVTGMCLPMPTSTLQLLHGLTVRLTQYSRVFDPFKIQLRVSQSAGTGPVTSPDALPAKTYAQTNININPAAVAQSDCETDTLQACL